MNSSQYNVKNGYDIPYYDYQSRSFFENISKIWNTILHIVAYNFPNNKIRIILHRMRGVKIGRNVYIGLRCTIDNYAPSMIYIEDNVNVNAETMILTHFNPSSNLSEIVPARVEPVLIKHGAVISVRSIILPGVQIGRGAIVSAGSVVDRNVPNYFMVRGNPAKKVLDFSFLMNR